MREYDFYIVPTPIGNLGDITYRAVEVLNSVDLIACEDSRVTQKLLNHFNIRTKCVSYHKYNEKERAQEIINFLSQGNKMALVSDAGTPLVCDPGSVIVKELRKHGFSVTALPGANAVITLLSQVSRENEAFTFIGFLPKKQNQIEQIVKKYEQQNLIFYESPNRIIETLKYIKNVYPNANMAIGRELTKIFEEIIIDNVDNIIKRFEKDLPKGEFVVMIFARAQDMEDALLMQKVKLLQDKGFSAKDISTILSELYEINKNKIYKFVLGK